MSRKRTVYTAEYKTRLVLEVLKEEKTLAEIASANKKHDIFYFETTPLESYIQINEALKAYR